MRETRCTECAVEEELHADLGTLLSEYALSDDHRRAILRDAGKRRPRPPPRISVVRLAAAAALLVAVTGILLLARDRETAPRAPSRTPDRSRASPSSRCSTRRRTARGSISVS
jgi:hypothetical protein